MKAIILAVCLVLGTPATAHANHQRRDDCRDGGGCNNDRRENSNYGQCRNFCPAFDKSPVQDSFNLDVCLPGATCYYGEPKKGDQGNPPPKEQQPQSVGCLVPFPYHCDPKPKETS